MRMRHPSSAAARVILFLLLMSVALPSAFAQEAEPKPLLSEEIRTILERDGAEAATKRFNEIFPAAKGKYELDQDGFGELAAEKMKNGDFATGQVLLEMLSRIVQESLAEMEAQMPEFSGERSLQKPAAATKEENEVMDNRSPSERLGPPRADLGRFTGMYGTQENVDKGRTLFVAESCEGHLVVGPMWADTSPWWMKSTSDTKFEFDWSDTSVRMAFVADPSGRATAMEHDLDFMDSPLPRVGPLPEEWRECIKPPWG